MYAQKEKLVITKKPQELSQKILAAPQILTLVWDDELLKHYLATYCWEEIILDLNSFDNSLEMLTFVSGYAHHMFLCTKNFRVAFKEKVLAIETRKEVMESLTSVHSNIFFLCVR